MFVCLIVLLICAVFGFIIGFQEDGIGDGIVGALGASFLGLLPSFLIGGMLSLLILGGAPMECKYTENMVALKDNTSISGSFFLGCGNIDSEMTYVYAVETDKGIVTKTIEKDRYDVYIKYTDGQPYVEYWDGEDDPWRLPSESAYYVFYVPEGSVINTYEIDLE